MAAVRLMRPAWTEVGKDEIPCAGKGDDAEFSQSVGEDVSCALDIANVGADGFSFAQGSLGGDQCGNVYWEWRHGSPNIGEGIFTRDNGSETKGGQPCGLRKCARDEEIGVAANPPDCGEPGKFCVGFVENNDGPGRGFEHPAERGGWNKRSRRIVWIGEKKDARLFTECGENFVQGKALLRIVTADLDACTGDFRVVAVHRECWFADENVRARFNESIEENAQCVIAAVGEKQLFGSNAEMASNARGGFSVLGIHRELPRSEFCKRAEDGGAAAGGVFVEVEADFVCAAFRGSFVGLAFENGRPDWQAEFHRRILTALR